MKSSVICGLGYGDEGKGLTTSYLTSQSKHPLVIRFNGGHQAGHTVIHNGIRHVFSHFGSGSLQGAPTYWSKFCTVSPIALLSEHAALKELGIKPKLFIDPLCPVTTPFDVEYNRQQARQTNHGSVGVGFGSTIERHEKYFRLYAMDLMYDSILIGKLKNIVAYYKSKLESYTPDYSEQFIEAVHDMLNADGIQISQPYFNSFDDYIFEGAQGILLDQDFGFFPNVTRSNTTSKNAMELIEEFELPAPEIYYVTRSYQTRHGNGYMTNENIPIELKNNHEETNHLDEYQGVFRKSPLDTDLLKYAIACDKNFSTHHKKNLVVTCTDQYEDDTTKTLHQSLGINFNNVIISKGNSIRHIEKLPEHKLSEQDVEF